MTPSTRCRTRVLRSASAGGQLEHPSDVNSSATTTALVPGEGTFEADRMLLTAEYDTARSVPRAPTAASVRGSLTPSKSPEGDRIFPQAPTSRRATGLANVSATSRSSGSPRLLTNKTR